MKENISIDLKNTEKFVSFEEIFALAQKSVIHLDSLNTGTGAGNDFLGWLSLPDDIHPSVSKLEKCARHLRNVSDTTVVVGIGGSYLGSKAIIEALSHSFSPLLKKKCHDVLFAGHNLCEDYISDLLELLDERNYSIIVISKSGTTIEPAIVFRILKEHLERRVGKAQAADRIIAVTDSSKGALRSLSELYGYDTFDIPDNIGGRYSVLSPVGLLPVAVSGLDISALIKGAKAFEDISRRNKKALTNPSLLYAAARNLLLQQGRSIEILAGFTPKLHYLAEWWKQLYGESEGKEGKGIFPASVNFTTDLHSLGQYIQEGQRLMFETILSIKNPAKTLTIPSETDNSDKLNFLSGKRVSEVNRCAETGTILAHNDGDVPVLRIDVPMLNEFYMGQLIYFFELACAISGYILGVNPFDQPGVEAYKNNMFALLNKPGFEEKGKRLKEKMKK
ncbi:MAG TPA: glucose-6-phosphate isomerase [Bacteroidales bacterium]|mgnify:FL=1|nr:glucose-6-phosphate isomerase [Bacteroidales bacterium]HPI67773.1 glucose-6-phosphate isomerase [Bacteroidales bacterium]HPR72314.1 glucose-6-phosphate isomerase [Bacteroidales bacterium]